MPVEARVSSSAYQKALQRTGYLTPAGNNAPGLIDATNVASARLNPIFADQRVGLKADAVFLAQNTATSIFKDVGSAEPDEAEIKDWHEAAWNVGIAPLLWIVTPTHVRLYDCYSSPPSASDQVSPPPLGHFPLQSEDRLRDLDAMCGRLATETGAFWTSEIGSRIDRRHRVDRELLAEIQGSRRPPNSPVTAAPYYRRRSDEQLCPRSRPRATIHRPLHFHLVPPRSGDRPTLLAR